MVSALVRAALVATALLVGAWLVLGLRSLHLESEGRAVLDQSHAGKLSAADLKRGLDLLEDAQRLNADNGPRLNEGLMLAAAGRQREGLDVVEQVLADEPDNLDGWYFVYVVTSDKRRAAHALARMRELDPYAADTLRPGRPAS